jgi:hypothetical protein
MASTKHPANFDLELCMQALGDRRWAWGVAPPWEYDTTMCRLEHPDLVVEIPESDLKHARREVAIGRAEAVPTNGPGEMAETMVLRYRLPCSRTFDQAFEAFAAIRRVGNTPRRGRLMEAYAALARIA